MVVVGLFDSLRRRAKGGQRAGTLRKANSEDTRHLEEWVASRRGVELRRQALLAVKRRAKEDALRSRALGEAGRGLGETGQVPNRWAAPAEPRIEKADVGPPVS